MLMVHVRMEASGLGQRGGETVGRQDCQRHHRCKSFQRGRAMKPCGGWGQTCMVPSLVPLTRELPGKSGQRHHEHPPLASQDFKQLCEALHACGLRALLQTIVFFPLDAACRGAVPHSKAEFCGLRLTRSGRAGGPTPNTNSWRWPGLRECWPCPHGRPPGQHPTQRSEGRPTTRTCRTCCPHNARQLPWPGAHA